jgi:hypothetical protein
VIAVQITVWSSPAWSVNLAHRRATREGHFHGVTTSRSSQPSSWWHPGVDGAIHTPQHELGRRGVPRTRLNASLDG